MNPTLVRKDFRVDGIFGELWDERGEFYCVTLERAYPRKEITYPEETQNTYSPFTYLPKIPPGKYRCTRFNSPHLGYIVWMLHDVPGHDHCLIHIGNYNENSDGCVLVGKQIGNKTDLGKMIMSSEPTFKKLMKDTESLTEMQLTVI